MLKFNRFECNDERISCENFRRFKSMKFVTLKYTKSQIIRHLRVWVIICIESIERGNLDL
jgi:hypothetical protein